MKLELVRVVKNDRVFVNLAVVLDDGTRIPVVPKAVSDKQAKYYRARLAQECRKEVK